MAVWIPWARVLVCGDYLSPVEIPMLHAKGAARAYLATLARLEPLVEQADHVVPGHGGADRRRARRRDPARGPRVPGGAARARRGREAAARAPDRRAAQDPRAQRRSACEPARRRPASWPRPSSEAALERMAADPPRARARARAGRAAARARSRREGLGGERALALLRDALLPATHRDRPPALPRLHPRRADAGRLAGRPAGQRLRRSTAARGSRRPAPSTPRTRRCAGSPTSPACRRRPAARFVQGGTNGNLSALHAARERARHGGATATRVAPSARRSTRRCARCCG